jgi:hypothetical protein
MCHMSGHAVATTACRAGAHSDSGMLLQALQKDLPPGVLDMHLTDSNMHNLHFVFSGPEDTAYAGGMCDRCLQTTSARSCVT